MMPDQMLTGGLIAGAALWSSVYYAAYAVRSQWLGATTWRGPATVPSIALTFDDGPAADTEAVLDVLAEHGVVATFFLIGEQVEKHPALARRIVEAGHEVGNHSYSHPIFLFCTPAETRRQLAGTQDAIAAATGVRPVLARPPCGVRSPAYFRAAHELGLRTVQWSATGYDWKPRSASAIAASVFAELQPGNIVLLHDGAARSRERRRETVLSLPLILSAIAGRALRCVRVSELLAAHPAGFHQHG